MTSGYYEEKSLKTLLQIRSSIGQMSCKNLSIRCQIVSEKVALTLRFADHLEISEIARRCGKFSFASLEKLEIEFSINIGKTFTGFAE